MVVCINGVATAANWDHTNGKGTNGKHANGEFAVPTWINKLNDMSWPACTSVY